MASDRVFFTPGCVSSFDEHRFLNPTRVVVFSNLGLGGDVSFAGTVVVAFRFPAVGISSEAHVSSQLTKNP